MKRDGQWAVARPFASTKMRMTLVKASMSTQIWVDSRARQTGGTDSNFEILLRESLHLKDARLRVFNINFSDSFLTTSAGTQLFFALGGTNLTAVSIPTGAYTGTTLATAIQTATGRTTAYDSLKNSITHTLSSASAKWVSDEELLSYSGSAFPSGSTPEEPMSLGQVLGGATQTTTTVTWNFVRMSPYSCLYLRSHAMSCERTHGPRGTSNIICQVPLINGVGSQVLANMPDSCALDLHDAVTLRSIDFQLTDYKGRVVDLKGRPLSFQISLD